MLVEIQRKQSKMVPVLAPALTWLGLSALGGFIGGRADSISCDAINQLAQLFKRPENHDISRAILKSLFLSLRDFLTDLKNASPFPNLEPLLDDCIHSISWSELTDGEPSPSTHELLTQIQNELPRYLDFVDSPARLAKRMEVERVLADCVLRWLDRKTGAENPGLLADLFRNGGTLNGVEIRGWPKYFRDYVGEAIKENDSRFAAILNTQLMASTQVAAKQTLAGVSSVLRRLEFFTDGKRSRRWDEIVASASRNAKFHFPPTEFRIASPVSSRHTKIPVGQEFQVSFDLPLDGRVLLLQRHEGQWYPTVVHSETSADAPHGSFVSTVSRGAVRFPLDTFLREDNLNHLGRRLFVLVHSANGFPSNLRRAFSEREQLDSLDRSQLAAFVDSLNGNDARVFVAECEFIAPQN